jgi:hypothetical protein
MAALSETLQRSVERGAKAAEASALLDELDAQFAIVRSTLEARGFGGGPASGREAGQS